MRSGSRNHLKTGVLSLTVSLLIAGIPAGAVLAQDVRPPVDTSAPSAITSTNDLVQWMTYYYLHPQPDLLVPALLYADSNGLVDKGQAPLTAFTSRVFAQNPKRISNWVAQLNTLSNTSKPMLWSALWWSNTVEGKEALDGLMKTLGPKEQEILLTQMAHPAEPIEQMEIKSPEVLDELWGAFSATGDEKYVNRLLTTLPWMANTTGDYNKMTIGASAKWSLASNAQQHARVLKFLMKARETQPQLRKYLDPMIADATKAGAAQTSTSNGPSL